jgi:hypothetical protein
MLAATDFYVGWPPIARVGTYSFERNAIEMEELRGPKVERPVWRKMMFDNLDDRVELPKSIPCLLLRKLIRIAD